MKLSTGKATTPGPKQVFRGAHADIIGLRDETVPEGTNPLLVPVMSGGRRTHRESIAEARQHFESDLRLLPATALQIRNPVEVSVALSPRAAALTTRISGELMGRDQASGV